MKKATKIWIWIALVMSAATTILNASYGRWSSVAIAVAAILGLCILLFAQKKAGFYLLCGSYAVAFINGVVSGASGGTNLLVSIGMSLIGSLLIPVVTYFFIRRDWNALK